MKNHGMEKSQNVDEQKAKCYNNWQKVTLFGV